jgi:hypothetical protein
MNRYTHLTAESSGWSPAAYVLPSQFPPPAGISVRGPNCEFSHMTQAFAQ